MAGPTIDPALYRDRDLVPIRRALISVSDKTDVLPPAAASSSRPADRRRSCATPGSR